LKQNLIFTAGNIALELKCCYTAKFDKNPGNQTGQMHPYEVELETYHITLITHYD